LQNTLYFTAFLVLRQYILQVELKFISFSRLLLGRENPAHFSGDMAYTGL